MDHQTLYNGRCISRVTPDLSAMLGMEAATEGVGSVQILASRIGATDFQSGQTVYRAKLDLGHRLVPLTNYCQHRNPFLHQLFARVARNISWATLDKDLAHHSTASGQY